MTLNLLGPDLETFRDTARVAAMNHYVAVALKDQRPATQRAMDTYKAGEARRVNDGATSDLLNREAGLRGIPVESLVAAILAEAAKAEQIELDRVSANLAIDAATNHAGILKALTDKGISLT